MVHLNRRPAAGLPSGPAAWRLLVRAARPGQWPKSLLVLSPVFFAGHLGQEAALTRSLLAAGLFTLAAAAVYLGNDLADLGRDRLHPVKRGRPLASGELAPGLAVAAAGGLAAAALGLAAWLLPAVALVLAAYLVLNLAYSWWLKHRAGWDLLCLALGLSLRVAAGGLAAPAPVTGWLWGLTLALALLLALGKRRAELTALAGRPPDQRPSLAAYRPELLRRLLWATAGASFLCYGLYLAFSATSRGLSAGGRLFSAGLVLAGLGRYVWLVERGRAGEDPARLVWRDPVTAGVLLAWLGTWLWLLYFSPRAAG
ncbi:MAG: UbiA family prenyltransferase [Deltaproteobacteria bacterium]|nr:UbiA family prenyltransferase [Deltaproteobacteria bacterium]